MSTKMTMSTPSTDLQNLQDEYGQNRAPQAAHFTTSDQLGFAVRSTTDRANEPFVAPNIRKGQSGDTQMSLSSEIMCSSLRFIVDHFLQKG